MTEHATALDAVQDPAPSTDHGHAPKVDRVRREWRVTKADLEAQLALAASALERRCTELAELRGRLVEMAISKGEAAADARRWRTLALAACGAFVVLGVWTW